MLNFKPNSLSWIELVINKLNRNKVLNLTNISTVLFGSIILIISAKIKVDLYPVPMTLQPLAVLMIGMLYGRNLATATIGLTNIDHTSTTVTVTTCFEAGVAPEKNIITVE